MSSTKQKPALRKGEICEPFLPTYSPDPQTIYYDGYGHTFKTTCFHWAKKWGGLLALVFGCASMLQGGQNIMLIWEPSPDLDVTGYAVYMGVASGSYTNRTDVGNVTNRIVLGLEYGVTYYFMVTAYNDIGLESDPSNEVFYTPTQTTNNRPSIAVISNQAVAESGTLSVNIIATDPDPGNTLTYSIATGPQGATLDPLSGIFSWTPTESQGPSTNLVTVRVTDNGSPSLSATQSFQIVVNEVNSAPTMAAIPNQAVAENSTLTLTITGNDPDLPANTLTYAIVSGPTGATLNSSTRQFSWTPTESQGPSTNLVTVRVTDNGTPSLSATQSFQIVVNEVNSAPTMAAIPNQAVAENSTLTLTITGSDPDLPANTLTYAIVSAPTGAALNSSTRQFSWTPTESQGPSTNLVTVRVTDNGTPSLSATQSFQIVVNEVNTPPTISEIPDMTIARSTSTGPIPFVIGDAETAATELQLSARSSNTNLVRMSGITFGGSGSNRTVTVAPRDRRTGQATITVLVSDGSLQANNFFTLTVLRRSSLAFDPILLEDLFCWMEQATEGGVTISWNTIPGAIYRVQSRGFAETIWTDRTEDIIAVDEITSWTDQDYQASQGVLYRIMAPY